MDTEKKITLEDVVRAELNELVNVSKSYQTNIKSATTIAKKDYFRKKLKKNNARVYEMLITLDRLSKVKKQPESTVSVPEEDHQNES